jgi:hypothetical protein
VASQRPDIEATGTQVAFVHMSRDDEADAWFERYGLADVVRVSDPGKRLYREFELTDGSFGQLTHPRVWLPWIRTALLAGHGVGFAGPNWRQLTGVFVVFRNEIVAAVRHRNSAARPNYVQLIQQAMAASRD